ncbi:hypothetical protein [Flavobacterium sp.]|uniref:hypothetical protein n=1 Tax=Flavobacterium sp. TaxID=239 RepID=UPI003A8D2AC1
MKNHLTFLLVLFTSFIVNATTWDEPWQKEIIQKSDCFVYGSVIQVNDTVVTVNVVKSFGRVLTGQIKIDGFFMLELCSMSGGHGPELHFKEGDEGYFFLKKGDNGNYMIPTPSSGFDIIVDGSVHATYRHTYHQAAVDPKVYEMTYSQIWNYYHNKKVNDAEVKKFIEEYLSKPVAGFEEDELDLFFNQHVALETAYLLNIPVDFDMLKKFAESENYHSQISAMRCMGVQNTSETKKYIISYIQQEDKSSFSKVMGIEGLIASGDKKYIKQLINIKDKVSDEETGFGGNIMDPRVCTSVPSPRMAIEMIAEG